MFIFWGILIPLLTNSQANEHHLKETTTTILEELDQSNPTEEDLGLFDVLLQTRLNSTETGRRKRYSEEEASLSVSQPNPDLPENDAVLQRRKKRSVNNDGHQRSSLSVSKPNPDLPQSNTERRKRSLNDNASLSVSEPNPDLPDNTDMGRKKRSYTKSSNESNLTSTSDNVDDVTSTLNDLEQNGNKSDEDTDVIINGKRRKRGAELDSVVEEILGNSTEPISQEQIELIKELEVEESVMEGPLDGGPQEIADHGVLTEHDSVNPESSKMENGEGEMSDQTSDDELEEKIVEDEAERMEEYKNLTLHNPNIDPLDNVDENKLLWLELKKEEQKDAQFDNGLDHDVRSSGRRRRRSSRKKRFLQKLDYLRWTKGVVPYRFDTTITEKAEVEIRATMARYEKYTCIRFVPYEGETTRDKYELDHDGFLIFVERNNGCWATQGNLRKKTGQEISCCQREVCIHEIGHALGLYHEHQSPVSHGWKIVNWNNIQKSAFRWYREIPRDTTLTFGYDFTNPMHYGNTEFGNGNGPTQSILFKELESIPRGFHNPFYLFSEISRSHQCAEVHCPEFKDQCVHGGYVTLVDNQCGCNCPPGFDPKTNCADILRATTTVPKWPKGSFAMFKPKDGCPEGFKSGSVKHNTVGANLVGSPFSLSGEYTSTSFTHEFCVISENQDGDNWGPGQYCIFRYGGTCPKGFDEGFIQFDDAEGEIQTSGKLPDGKYTDDVGFHVCCRNDGFLNEPISMPLDTPFVLMPLNYQHGCQQVIDAEGYNEYMRFENDVSGVAELSGSTKFVFDMFNKYKIHFCYYAPYNKDCGKVIKLTADAPEVTFTSPGYPESYSNKQECSWLIEGPTDSNILLNFEDFDFEVADGKCKDGVEIRYNQIGQTGFRYCGSDVEKSIRSINNFIVLWMKTDLTGTRKGFKANVKLITPEDLCYEARDRGVSYRGSLSYDREFTQCVPWSQTTNCPFHQFSDTGSGAPLEGNSCRNPDNTFRPWCYIRNGEGECMRNYCDVCGFESLYDKDADCEKLKAEGFCSKPRDEVIFKCAKTCGLSVAPVDKVSSNTCSAPEVPDDADPKNDLDSSYSVGDTVTFQCKSGSDLHNVTCLSDGTWSPGKFVCGGCSPGWTRFRGECYQFFNDPMSFTDAEQMCEQHGGLIASIKNQEELHFLSSVRPRTEKMWIGLSDRDDEGVFKWLDGSELVWDNWSEGSPSSSPNNNEDCVIMYGEQVDSKWNDRPCSSQYYKYPFICQYKPSERTLCINRRSDCRDLLETTPTMCQDYPDFSAENCGVECGICRPDSVEAIPCTVEAAGENVLMESTKTSLDTGEVVSYNCREGFEMSIGDLKRVCLVDGSLSGSPPQCKSAETSIQPNNNIQLIRFSRVGNLCKMYTANNDNFRIPRSGEIIQWDFYSLYPGDAAFVVFRPTDDPFKFKLIGVNRVSNTVRDGVQNLEIPSEERIQVVAGDQIGLWYGYKRAGIPFDFCDAKERPDAVNTIQINGFLCNPNSLKIDAVFEFNQKRVLCRVYSFRAIIGPRE